jgi:penicillin amidase
MSDRARLLGVLGSGDPVDEACARAGLSVAEFREARDACLRAKLPPRRETLDGTVEVVRDRWGIPHVFAADERGALLGLGYCMGRDRLWQLDYMRREAQGSLAELLGPAAHDGDLRMRTIGIAEIAEAEAERIDAETGALLDGFVAGINHAIEAQRADPPVELELLEYVPEPWTRRDTLALLRAFWWQLTGRLENVVAAEAAQRHLGGDEMLLRALLTPELPDERIVPAGAFRPPPDLPVPEPMPQVGVSDATGSNNWVVAKERTTTGAALLASDPHLPFVHPSDWYESHLSWPGHDAVGAHYVGAPGAFFGHNRRIAWGLTNNASSPRDLYVEQVNPANPNEYRRDDRWQPFATRTVEIGVRGEGVRRHELRRTDIGPVMNAVTPPAAEGGDPPLSMRWIGAEHLDDVRALLAVQRASDWGSFHAALAEWALPIFNWVYADADGAIGYQCAGRVPLRGRVVRGYRQADEPADRWSGYVPYEALPRLGPADGRNVRPPRGFHATANNRVAADDYPYPLYGTWAGGNRALRIRQRLEAVEKVSPAESRDVQNDVYLIRAARLAPALARILAGHSSLAEKLVGWDFRYTPESEAAMVFEAVVHFLAERLIAARFPARLGGLLHGSGVALAARLLEGEPIGWLEGTSLEDEVRAAAAQALEFLNGLGTDWAWGKHHTFGLVHPLSAQFPALAEVADVGPRPVSGTGDSVRNAAGSITQGFRVVSGAEYRLLVDFAAQPIGVATNTLGQSGQPGSPHFADQLDDWLAGRYHPLLMDREEIVVSWQHAEPR